MAASALGRCIDRLLRGGDWEAELPGRSPEREEVVGLMAVAQRLLGMARRIRPLDPAGKRRVWAATERHLTDRKAALRAWLPPVLVPS